MVEHLSFVGNAFGEDDIECRDAVGSYHNEVVVVDVVDVTHFAVVYAFLCGKIEVCFYNSIHSIYFLGSLFSLVGSVSSARL